MSLIELNNITKVFGSGETEVIALKDVNLKIDRGEFIAIVGTSGSGKSTLMNIIGTLDKQTEGDYLLDNKRLAEINYKKLAKIRNSYFGFIVQHFALINYYTVYENIEVPLTYSKTKKINFKQRVYEVAQKVNLQNKIKNKPTQLSGGQCQRVAIARALVNNPEVILADEPTGSLDKQTGLQVLEIFKKLNKEGKTIILVTHDANIASQCNRIIKIEDGYIVDDTRKKINQVMC